MNTYQVKPFDIDGVRLYASFINGVYRGFYTSAKKCTDSHIIHNLFQT